MGGPSGQIVPASDQIWTLSVAPSGPGWASDQKLDLKKALPDTFANGTYSETRPCKSVWQKLDHAKVSGSASRALKWRPLALFVLTWCSFALGVHSHLAFIPLGVQSLGVHSTWRSVAWRSVAWRSGAWCSVAAPKSHPL